MLLYNYKPKNRIILDSILVILFLAALSSDILASEAFENRAAINIFQNLKSVIPQDIKKRFELFNTIYDNNFWGENNKFAEEKQKALKETINKIIGDNHPKLLTILEKAFIVSPEEKKVVENYLPEKVPIVFGGVKELLIGDQVISMENESYNSQKLNEFRKILYPKINYSKTSENNFFNTSLIAFPATITPCWRWDAKEEELKEKDNIGVIFCNGVNFESNQTADYQRFNDIDADNKEQRLKDLEEFINTITLCVVTAAHRLTKKENRKTCELRIPQFGLGCFASFYNDRFKLMNLYLNGIYKAILKEEFHDITWNIRFFNFSGDKNYFNFYQQTFNSENRTLPNNIETECIGKDISIFAELKAKFKNDQSDSLIVFAHAGDQHSFLGNGGYNDSSLEKYLIGFNNEDFLNASHLLNLFLPEIISGNKKIQTKLEYFAALSIIGVIAFFVYLKREHLKNVLNTMITYFQELEIKKILK